MIGLLIALAGICIESVWVIALGLLVGVVEEVRYGKPPKNPVRWL